MTTRRTLFRALAALATLPLFGKGVGAEAAPDAASECAAQGGNYEQLSATEWRCALPEPGVWGFVTDYYPDSDMLDYSTTRYEWVPRSVFH